MCIFVLAKDIQTYQTKGYNIVKSASTVSKADFESAVQAALTYKQTNALKYIWLVENLGKYDLYGWVS